ASVRRSPAAGLFRGESLMAVDVSTGTTAPRGMPAEAGAALVKTDIGSRLDRDGLLVLIVGGYAGLLFGLAGLLVSTDSWYALVGGRLIVRHGLPSHNTLTLWAHGANWVDQQWLPPLPLYAAPPAAG